MTEPSDRTFAADFKRFFLRGLVILLPSVLTLWIVVKAYQFVDASIAEPINRGVRLTMHHTTAHLRPLRDQFEPGVDQINAEIAERARDRRLVSRDEVRRELLRQRRDRAEGDREDGDGENDISEERLNAAMAERAIDTGRISRESVRADLRQTKIDEWWEERWYLNLIGLVIAIVVVYTAGRLLGSFLGRRLYRKLEQLITTLPVFKQVYPYVKQIVDFLFSEDQPMKFNRVVVVEYPRKGIWSVGFLTGPTLKSVSARSGTAVTVFIPSSPTPFTGYTITVPQEEALEVPITVEEAIRFAVSGGVLIPDREAITITPQIAPADAAAGPAPLPVEGAAAAALPGAASGGRAEASAGGAAEDGAPQQAQSPGSAEQPDPAPAAGDRAKAVPASSASGKKRRGRSRKRSVDRQS